MVIYYAFVPTILFVWYINYRNQKDKGHSYKEMSTKKQDNIVVAVGFFYLFFILALRHQSMGNDLKYLESNGYLGSFDKISSYSWDKIWHLESFMNYEKGFIIFNKLIGSIWENRQFFMAVVAFLALVPIAWLISKRSNSPLLSWAIFFGLPVFLMMFSGLRQVLAIGLCVLSIKYVEKKQVVPFIILVYLATLFHSSSVIFFITYPLYYIKLNKIGRWISLAILGIVYLFRNKLFVVFSVLFKDTAEIKDTGAITLFLVFTTIYFMCCVIVDENKYPNLSGFMNLFYMACIFQSFAGVHELAMRVGYYYMVFLIVLLPNAIMSQKDKRLRIILAVGVFISFILFGFYSIKTTTWANASNYYFFWEEIKVIENNYINEF